jgi:beta-lactamase regulating signal transducer with metallopeptidase domain
MNAVYSWVVDRGLAAGPIEGIVARISLVLAVAWISHAALVRANPRWRVLVWRVAAAGVLIVPAVSLWGPAISLDILAAETPPSAITPTAAAHNPSPGLGSAGHGEPAWDASIAIPPPAMANFSPIASPVETPTPTEAIERAALSRRADWMRIGLTIWIVGIALGLVGEVSAWWQLRALRRRTRPANPEVIAVGQAIAARLGCRQSFEIRQTSDLDSPCVFGARRRVILLPEIDCHPEQRGALPAILSHEIGHLMGGDLPWDGLLRVLSRLLWWHPLMWRVRSAHLAACDAVCDATAASLLGDVVGYGQVLARLALRLATVPSAPALQMARPSSVRRRIEALHRRLYAARPARMAVALSIAAGLLLVGLCGALSIARATAAAANDGLTVSGQILNFRAEPIPGATVFVHSAGVREGTSPYCPTCYVDCGKRATTGADGRFTLSGLDSTLVFQLLAVAEGHRPAFIKQVDPRSGEDVSAELAIRPIPDDPDRVVRGRVIDPNGRPAVGAVVESFGCQTAEKRWWGRMDGVDPLAVTDERGEFALVCDAPVIGLDLKVEARGAVRKNFELVKSDGETHRLELAEGATVTGRVLEAGQPLAGVMIGICQADRGGGTFLGPYRIGTDDDGRFTLANLPSDGELLVYGIMQSMPDGITLPAKKFMPAEAATTDVGDLTVVPSHTIRGRVALADGKQLPPHTRVMLSRDEAWDSNFTEAAADGTFAIRGVPPEVVHVSARVKGYRLSPKNMSYAYNGIWLLGLVSGDVEDLTILYEPRATVIAEDARDFRAESEKHKRLRTEGLAGVTTTLEEFPSKKEVTTAPAEQSAPPALKMAPRPLPKIELPPDQSAPVSADDGGPSVELSGSVVDSHGQAVDKAQVWLPVQWLNPFETLTATASYGGSTPFHLSVPDAWLPAVPIQRNPIAWAYAPGHAIGTGSAYAQIFGGEPEKPFQIELPPAGDLSFLVLLPNGEPAVGARVEPLHFKTPRAYDYVPHELVDLIAGTTDAAGRTTMPALTWEGVWTIDVKLAGYGTQRFDGQLKDPTDPPEQTLQLRTTGRVEGRIAIDQIELARDMFVSIETNADLPPDVGLRVTARQPFDAGATGVATVQVDQQGQFVIPEIAVGGLQVSAWGDARLPVRARLPERNELRLFAGRTLSIEIPLEMGVRVSGMMRAKDTQEPVVGATLFVSDIHGHGGYALTDAKGEYSALVLAGEVNVQPVDLPKGYQLHGQAWIEPPTVPADVDEFALPPIEIAPTTEIEGKLVDQDGRPMADVRVVGKVGDRRHSTGQTDEHGVFTLTGVPIGFEIETFMVFTRDAHFSGVVESREPLVVRVGELLGTAVRRSR